MFVALGDFCLSPKQKELLAHRATKVTHSVYDFGIQSDKNHLPIKSLNNPKQKEILAHRELTSKLEGDIET